MTSRLHPLVERQIRRHLASGDPELRARLEPFVRAISDAYSAADRDRALLERSLELSSEELIEANEALRSVFRASPDHHVWTTAEGIVRRSQSGEAMNHGLSADLSVGSSIFDGAHRSARQAMEAAFAEVGSTGKAASIEYGMVSHGAEEIYEIRLLVVPGDDRVVVIRNVTALVRAEQDRFRMLANHVEEVLWLATPQRGAFVYVNPAFERVWGVAREELYCDPSLFLEAIHAEDRDRVRAAAANNDHDLEYRVIKSDGSTRWVRDRAFPIRDSAGAVLRVSGIITDITDHRVVNEELAAEVRESRCQLRVAQKMEAVGRLAGGIAYDFNNLFSIVLSYGEFLAEELEASHPHYDDTQQILAAGRRGAALTQQILTFSRQEVIEPRVLDLHALLRNLDGLLRPLLREDVPLSMHLADDALRVRMDPSQIEQVIINLATNARDAMPRGGRLCIRTATHTVDDVEFVAIEVEDSGVGMSDEVKARCLDPFFTTKPDGRGTGLGLASVVDIVQKSGGHVSIDSKPYRGTCITVSLPRCMAPETVRAPTGSLPEDNLAPSARILLVEDDEAVRRVAKRILGSAGYAVHSSPGGPEALALWHTLDVPADLLLTDVVMPTIDGRELAACLTRRWPSLRVLFMSGYTDDSHLKEAVTAGRVRMLNKPFTPNRLLEGVRAALFDESASGA